MKKIFVLSLSIMLVCGMTTSVLAYSLSGSTNLVTNDDANLPKWVNPTLTWEVKINASGLWEYTYWFDRGSYQYNPQTGEAEADIYAAGLSHLIIEVSDTFTKSNLKGGSSYVSSSFDADTGEVVYTTDQNGNPGMPEGMYGIRYDGGDVGDYDDPHVIVIITDRAPMWGDFYAKDGGGVNGSEVIAYNAGFGGLFNGTIHEVDWQYDMLDFLLVPDTVTIPPEVPEPSTVLLLGIGLLGILGLGRKFKK